MRIDTLYNDFESYYNTHQAGFIRPVADFVPAVHEVSLAIFNSLAKKQSKTQVIQDVLLPFKTTKNIVVQDVRGTRMALYPKDYKYFAAAGVIIAGGKTYCDKDSDLWDGRECTLSSDIAADFFPPPEVTYQRKTLTLIKPNQWSGLLNHPTRKPDIGQHRVYIKQEKVGFEVAPSEAGVVIIEYYVLPTAPVYNYTLLTSGVDAVPSFNETNSVHLEWGDEMLPTFLYKLGQRFGLTHKDEQMVNQIRAIDTDLIA